MTAQTITTIDRDLVLKIRDQIETAQGFENQARTQIAAGVDTADNSAQLQQLENHERELWDALANGRQFTPNT